MFSAIFLKRERISKFIGVTGWQKGWEVYVCGWVREWGEGGVDNKGGICPPLKAATTQMTYCAVKWEVGEGIYRSSRNVTPPPTHTHTGFKYIFATLNNSETPPPPPTHTHTGFKYIFATQQF